ncbi:hypoxanthine phosphoribosyltransferase [Candidatus Woesearchaeota archaeon]|nr:hypoxanthine phosphoribosyltransferase [Candidatus Woesearchaeota archaeon]
MRLSPLIGVNQLVVPPTFEADLKGILIPKGYADARIEKLAAEISEAPVKGDLLAICVLNGAMHFYDKLIGQIAQPVEVDTIRLGSYNGTSSTGVIREYPFDYSKCQGRDVLVVEDIIDTGRTLEKLVGRIRAENLLSLRVACLLDKPERRDFTVTLKPDHIGFVIPDLFVVGYGLDFNNRYRGLAHISVLKDELTR